CDLLIRVFWALISVLESVESSSWMIPKFWLNAIRLSLSTEMFSAEYAERSLGMRNLVRVVLPLFCRSCTKISACLLKKSSTKQQATHLTSHFLNWISNRSCPITERYFENSAI